MVIFYNMFFRQSSRDFHSTPILIHEKENKYPEIIRVHYFNKPKGVNGSRFKFCKHKCYLTHSKSSYETSHAVIFHGPSLASHLRSPPKKYLGQIWILHGKESLVNYAGSLKAWKNVFNWTMTHRRDSDIIALNGVFKTRSHGLHCRNKTGLYQLKTKNIAWFASNCQTHSGREFYVDQLRSLMNVAIYGKCGKEKCARFREKTCMDILRKNFKFYLSFENSFCLDYITEKSFKIYRHNSYVIPVTRGLLENQYTMYLPPKSYINTADFPSLKTLVDSLQTIAENETIFNSYFEWEKYYSSELYTPQDFCQLCGRLHNEDKYRRLYKDISAWLGREPYYNVCNNKSKVLSKNTE
ncbi:glycoprotein 3-alpha-L-fucosyltransferase A-like [Ylistrum balloti]|uniref:glycoprotein 3-alpha-L-fucosyltransferase A-like n=1 Tax=Ylistrum balloti TaxID=509963 RepID=UPI002905E746|nr:glycoprotein 3-alpha-L-fucosyltransferase A-like [Ylistrum balloti]